MSERPPPNLNAISVEDLARLLTASYPQPTTPEDIHRAIADGAPVNPDGTVHFIKLLAWLVRDGIDARDRRSRRARIDRSPPAERGE